MKKLFTWSFSSILLFSTVHAKFTVSPNLVISQVYGDGGTSGSVYANDFIEIYNAGSTAIDLSNYSVQYASGTSWTMTALTAVTLQPGQYYLIKEASNGANGIQLPNADATGTISLHSNMGKVALVNSTIILPNGCTSPLIIDLVGYGNATCYEGLAATAGSNTASITRKPGNIDTDNNSTDFYTAPPNPRTSSFTLPISIGSFSVNRNEKSNQLNWQLNCTSASLLFKLQRSGNGIQFENIYHENASQARCKSSFSFLDTRPHPVTYYRLKIIDPDKNFSYSNIISITNKRSEKHVLAIHPTKVINQATIKYNSNVSANIQWIISTINGRVIKKITGKVIPGENNVEVNTSILSAGQYQIKGYTLQGNTEAIKFVKQ